MRAWYSVILNMPVDMPFQLPDKADLAHFKDLHPNPSWLKLLAQMTSIVLSEQRDFQKEL